jgi:hypothetical protein
MKTRNISTLIFILTLIAQISTLKKFKTKTTAPASNLPQGASITTGNWLVSPNGLFSLKLQADGNLALYGCHGAAIWDSQTNNSSAQRVLIMQADGNLVLYENGVYKWQTATYRKGVGPYNLVLQDDGNLVIYDSAGYIWNTATYGQGGCDQIYTLRTGESAWSQNGIYRLTVQTDGNLVLYGCGDKALWHIGANNSTAQRLLLMQEDGNLVLYQGETAIWHTHTYGKAPGPYSLKLQNDGNLVIYASTGAIWETQTYNQGICPLCTVTQNVAGAGTNNNIQLTYFDTGANYATQCNIVGEKVPDQKYCCNPSIVPMNLNDSASGKYIKVNINGADTVSITTLIINDKVLNYFLMANSRALKAGKGGDVDTQCYDYFNLSTSDVPTLLSSVDRWDLRGGNNCQLTWGYFQ